MTSVGQLVNDKLTWCRSTWIAPNCWSYAGRRSLESFICACNKRSRKMTELRYTSVWEEPLLRSYKN